MIFLFLKEFSFKYLCCVGDFVIAISKLVQIHNRTFTCYYFGVGIWNHFYNWSLRLRSREACFFFKNIPLKNHYVAIQCNVKILWNRMELNNHSISVHFGFGWNRKNFMKPCIAIVWNKVYVPGLWRGADGPVAEVRFHLYVVSGLILTSGRLLYFAGNIREWRWKPSYPSWDRTPGAHHLWRVG